MNSSDITNWFQNHNPFFILGIGRSGTKLLAALLNLDKTALVFHEPISSDSEQFVIAHKSDLHSLAYFIDYRLLKMHTLVKNIDFNIYGEVNSFLRYHTGTLQKLFPAGKFLHLVRDGRDVVRSFMPRTHYSQNARGHHILSPLKGDPCYKYWANFSRFEKLCWLWSDSIIRVSHHIDRLIKFELLITSYSYFYENIECYLGLSIGEEAWLNSILTPKNVTVKHTIPRWQDWDGSLMSSFLKICGKQMEYLDY